MGTFRVVLRFSDSSYSTLIQAAHPSLAVAIATRKWVKIFRDFDKQLVSVDCYPSKPRVIVV